MSRYAEILSAPAKSLDPAVTEKTFRIHAEQGSNVFQYPDTNASRANFQMINSRLEGQKIAIVGLGGTGAYVLDLLAKTPVAEIHLFDADLLLQHNAFRSPGAVPVSRLNEIPKKVNYYAETYSQMHKKIIPHDYFIHEGNLIELDDLSCVFICVDRNSSRRLMMPHLLKVNVPFIDSGLGIQAVNESLIGTVRVTVGTAAKNTHLSSRVALEDYDDDLYKSNIQIADLNMLNASLAVLKWKKMCRFYQDLIDYNHCTYTINTAHLDTTDFAA
jgi:hypothetical protein